MGGVNSGLAITQHTVRVMIPSEGEIDMRCWWDLDYIIKLNVNCKIVSFH